MMRYTVEGLSVRWDGEGSYVYSGDRVMIPCHPDFPGSRGLDSSDVFDSLESAALEAASRAKRAAEKAASYRHQAECLAWEADQAAALASKVAARAARDAAALIEG